MQLLLRKKVYNRRGDAEFTDIEINAAKIDIGSAPKSQIQILGQGINAIHATIVSKVLRAKKSSGIVVGDKAVNKVKLEVGQEFSIAQHRFLVIAAPSGFDLALEWIPGNASGALLANAYQTQLSQTFLNIRLWAWLSVLLIMAIGGAYPLYEYYYPQPLTDKAVDFEAEKLWSSGPLHEAHQSIIGDQCDACHQAPFVQVEDKACVNCHVNVADHISSINKNHAEFASFQCQDCHKEHNEPAYLTVLNDGLCVSCHAKEQPAISSLAPGQHPEFRLGLVLPDHAYDFISRPTDWKIERHARTQELKENSGLKFPHDTHMDIEKVRHLNNDAQLQCSSCHVLKADKEHFEPIQMEQHCRACHELGFDTAAPHKQLPHGNPEQVWETIQAHYIQQSFNAPKSAIFKRRRLPGKPMQEASCKNDLACALTLSQDEMEGQFSQRGCVSCHEITVNDKAEMPYRWQVQPVKLASNWHLSAQFNHQSHLTQQGDTGNALCISCHEADVSHNSTDILIPGIDNCLTCHNSAHPESQVVLQCSSCHGFHQQDAALSSYALDEKVK